MLLRKMLRDLWLNRGSYTACAVIIALGVLIFYMFSVGYSNFYVSQETYYKAYNFAEGFVELENMPISKVGELSQIEGIKEIEGRYVKDVKIISNDKERSAYLRLISYEPNQQLNRVKVLKGQLPLKENRVLLDNKFFIANDLKIGDSIEILCSGKKSTLEVIGMGQTPEYIYALRTDQDIYPDDLTFGIAFIPTKTMEKLMGSSGQINQLSFLMDNESSFKDIKYTLKSKLKSYGLKKIYPRKDQKSHLVLKQEMDGLESMAKVMPTLFLLVAAMIMTIILRRMTQMQRLQIGVMKAFGYTDRTILFHYVLYAVVIGIFGGILGGVLGSIMVIPFTGMYQQMFNMPLKNAAFSSEYFLKGMALVLCFSMLAGLGGAKDTLKLEPSEAMRAPSPSTKEVIGGKRFLIFFNKLHMNSRMALRSIFRNIGRSVFVLLGMVFTIALLGMPWSMKNAMDSMIYDQFDKVQTYDMKITMTNPVDYQKALREVAHDSGVRAVEGLMEVPFKLSNQGMSKDVVAYGIPNKSKLYHLYDKKNQEYFVSGNDLVLSERLAQLLHVKVGDKIFVESLYMRDTTDKKEVTVGKIIPQYLGLNAYMNDQALINLLGQSPFITSILLNGSEAVMEKLKEDYKDSDIVFGLDAQQDLMDKYDEMMKMFLSMVFMLCMFGIITGFAVIYASSIITISERKKELASMLVIGMSYKQVLSIVIIEQWILTGFAILFGIPLMKLMLVGMAKEMNNDIYTMPSDISFLAVLTSVGMTAISIIIAQRAIKRKIDDINLVEALSIKE